MTAELARRRQAVLAALDEIIDPCSRGLGRPVGLVGMGMIDGLEIAGDLARVTILPTFPNCMFRGVLEAEVERRVGALPWCREVVVEFAKPERIWDESRLSAAARRTLGRALAK
jgi:metal-sulfur cluster biosynthetic enzyme